MTKSKLTKHEDDVRRGLATPQPYDGIHTCSKGCKKQGCNRGLRETIEEQNAQIEGLKRDLLEKTAAVRSQFANSEEENARLNNYIERLEVRNAELVAENARLKADIKDFREDRIRMHTVTIEDIAVIARLQAEVERLKKPAVIGGYNISEYIRMANSETLEFDNGDIFADMTLPERIKYIVESHARLKAEVERLDTLCKQLGKQHSDISCENIMLRKAGDAMAEIVEGTYCIDKPPALIDWLAAKEGKPSV